MNSFFRQNDQNLEGTKNIKINAEINSLGVIKECNSKEREINK